MLKCRSVPRILKGHGRVVPLGQDECDGSSRVTERTRHVLGQSAFGTATLRSFQPLPDLDDTDAAGQQFPQFAGIAHASPVARSEEHTSELQSLMRISYAVFCLKKKTSYHDHTLPS